MVTRDALTARAWRRLVAAGAVLRAALTVTPARAPAAYAAAEQISFEGAFFRRDIGWRELNRRARAS